jgi:hypothetical protein
MVFVFYNRILISQYIGAGLILIYFGIAVIGAFLINRIKKMKD